MPRLPILSGAEEIHILANKFDFEEVRRAGSHVVLRKYEGDRKITTVVPLHREIKIGTLSGILAQAAIEKRTFLHRL